MLCPLSLSCASSTKHDGAQSCCCLFASTLCHNIAAVACYVLCSCIDVAGTNTGIKCRRLVANQRVSPVQFYMMYTCSQAVPLRPILGVLSGLLRLLFPITAASMLVRISFRLGIAQEPDKYVIKLPHWLHASCSFCFPRMCPD